MYTVLAKHIPLHILFIVHVKIPLTASHDLYMIYVHCIKLKKKIASSCIKIAALTGYRYIVKNIQCSYRKKK